MLIIFSVSTRVIIEIQFASLTNHHLSCQCLGLLYDTFSYSPSKKIVFKLLRPTHQYIDCLRLHVIYLRTYLLTGCLHHNHGSSSFALLKGLVCLRYWKSNLNVWVRPGFKSQLCHFQVMWPLTSSRTSLRLFCLLPNGDNNSHFTRLLCDLHNST